MLVVSGCGGWVEEWLVGLRLYAQNDLGLPYLLM